MNDEEWFMQVEERESKRGRDVDLLKWWKWEEAKGRAKALGEAPMTWTMDAAVGYVSVSSLSFLSSSLISSRLALWWLVPDLVLPQR